MFVFELIADLILFFVVIHGLACPFVSRLKLDPAEKLVAAVALSLLTVYLAAFAIYIFNLPRATFWLLPALAVAGLLRGRETLRAAWGDPDARSLLVGQWLVTGWCVAWMFFIVSYVGGGWTSDWYEHWERALFFVDRWPLDAKFIGLYPLPARPPLANLVTGAFLSVTSRHFAHYQLFTTLLNSLAFLPAALLVRRFQRRQAPAGGPVALAVFALLLMLNPSFMENATFAWTKLIAVVFILAGLYFFLRCFDRDAPAAAGPLCAAALGAGLLAHYSAGPYVLLLGVAWIALNRRRLGEAAWWRQTLLLVLIGGAVLVTWFGWSFAVYGVHATLFSNSSVNVKDMRSGNQLLKIALNLRDTLVPHFLRPLDPALITQRNPWGYWHDWFFQLYQVNLLFVFGLLGWLVLLRELVRGWTAAAPGRWFWAGFSGGVIVLGVAVHGARDTWGLAHICLQAIVLLGLAYLAACWSRLGRAWRTVLLVGATLDFLFGIALHFLIQSYVLDRWTAPGGVLTAEILQRHSESAFMNIAAKIQHRIAFFGDVFPLPAALVLVLLAVILAVAVTRAGRRPA